MKRNKERSREIQLLAEFKKESGWTYPQLGQAIGVNAMTVYHWLRRNQQPSIMARRLIRQFLIENEPKKAI
jgi:DNA-binding transcriptional regulator YiaG